MGYKTIVDQDFHWGGGGAVGEEAQNIFFGFFF